MCLAIPALVTEILADDQVKVALGGLHMNVSTELLEDSVQTGDYLIIHVGFAIGKLDPVQAEHTLALFARMGSIARRSGGPLPANRMKYMEAFRDGALASKLAAAIRAETNPARQYRLMEFCGGHTHAIARYGLPDLLPGNIRLIHGPGCPVCVLPAGRIDDAIVLSREHGVILCTYADTLRVPTSGGMSLLKARAAGADVRMIYSCSDALATRTQ